MRALLLINLGTPKSPAPDDVGHYLKEFLMDPLVIDIPWIARWPLVNWFIVPKRKIASGKLYEKIWSRSGSPLLFYSEQLTEKVRARLVNEAHVELGMRYGEPSLRDALERLKVENPSSLTIMPLYPQYSLAAYESSVKKVQSDLKAMNWSPRLSWVPPFYDHPAYLDAVAKVSRPTLEEGSWDKILFSFHGLPERQVKKTDPSRQYCLVDNRCCDKGNLSNQQCYRYQCFETARSLAKLLSIPQEKWVVGFQSRLGRTPWIRPYSDHWYNDLPKLGVKRLAVLCPSFVADCLETLEEVQLRGNEQFQAAGGEMLRLVPSVNSEDVWADAVVQITRSLKENLPHQSS